MNPHRGRRAPRKKKKAPRKERKMPVGSCVATLPCFEKVVVETGNALEEEVFARRRIFTRHTVTARGGCEIGVWLDETIAAQKGVVRNYVRDIALGLRKVQPFVGIPWSVCIVPCHFGMTDYDGFGLVCVVLLDYVVVRPVGKIVAALESFLKWHRRASNDCEVDAQELLAVLGLGNKGLETPRAKTADEEDCWLCLEPFDTAEVHLRWDADYFCCGHLLCQNCTPRYASLKHCGVCRAVPPPQDGLEERIMRRVKNNAR
jgi:hypothetical protein